MAQEQLIHFLQNSGRVNAAQAAEIAGNFTRKTINKNALLLQPGRVSDEYLFVDSGLIRAFVHDVDGQEVTTSFYSSGQVAFEVSSFFNRTPSQEYLQALTDSTGWHITYEQLNALFHSRPEFREFGRSVLVRALTSLKARMLDQITEPAASRYEKLVQTNPEIVQHAPLKYVASYLGVTDTSLSRIRAGARHPSNP
jgi:CRP-like cAMP-binding protein